MGNANQVENFFKSIQRKDYDEFQKITKSLDEQDLSVISEVIMHLNDLKAKETSIKKAFK